MTKFDHRSQLPKLFRDHNLSILPTPEVRMKSGKFKTFCVLIKRYRDNSY